VARSSAVYATPGSVGLRGQREGAACGKRLAVVFRPLLRSLVCHSSRETDLPRGAVGERSAGEWRGDVGLSETDGQLISREGRGWGPMW